MWRRKNSLWGSAFCTIFLIILSFFLLDPAYCSDSDTAATQKGPFKRWQLLFSTGSYLIPRSDYDIMINLQYNLSPECGIRFGVRSNFRKAINRGEGYYNSIYSFEDRADTLTRDFALTLCYVKYSHPKNNLGLYFGLGPIIIISDWNRSERSENFDFSYYHYDNDNRKSHSLGIESIIGVEYDVSGLIKISAEYNLDFLYGYYSWKRNSGYYLNNWSYTEKYSGKYFLIDANYVRTSISIVF